MLLCRKVIPVVAKNTLLSQVTSSLVLFVKCTQGSFCKAVMRKLCIQSQHEEQNDLVSIN